MVDAQKLEVGQSSGPIQMVISPEWNRKYRAATGDHSTPETHDDRSIAPPMMTALIGRRAMSWIQVPPGAVHAKQSYRFRRPLPVGEELIVQSTIRDLYEKRGKNYLVIEVTVTDSAGTLIAEGATTRVNSFVEGSAQ